MMGFWVVILNLWLLSMFFWAIVCSIAAIVLTIVYRRRRRRWQKVTAVICGVIALICVAVLAALFIMAAVSG